MKFYKLIWLTGATMLAIILSSCNLGGAATAPAQDPGAIQTQAFGIVLTQVAQQTQTAQAAIPASTQTPTATVTQSGPATFAPVGGSGGTVTPFASLFTPIASVVPTLGGAIPTTTTKNGCNDGMYLGEYPHYTDATHFLEVTIGEVVEQFFTYKNTGTCAWDEGYAFVFQPEYSSPELEGNTITLIKGRLGDFTAPGNSQSYKGIIKAPKTAGDYKAFWKLRDDGGNEFGALVSLFIRVRKP